MTLPTIQHLLTVAEELEEVTPLELLKALWPIWDGLSRRGRSWRLGYNCLDSEATRKYMEFLRGPALPPEPGHIDKPGPIYEFPTGEKAFEFRDACVAKLERHLNKVAKKAA